MISDKEFFNELFKRTENTLNVVAIYKNPKDYPSKCVGRLFLSGAGIVYASINIYIVKDTVEEIRNLIPRFYARLKRDIQDDPQIVESWVW